MTWICASQSGSKNFVLCLKYAHVFSSSAADWSLGNSRIPAVASKKIGVYSTSLEGTTSSAKSTSSLRCSAEYIRPCTSARSLHGFFIARFKQVSKLFAKLVSIALVARRRRGHVSIRSLHVSFLSHVTSLATSRWKAVFLRTASLWRRLHLLAKLLSGPLSFELASL